MKNRIVSERFYENGNGSGVTNKSLSFEFDLPEIIDRGETIMPTINNVMAIEILEYRHRKGNFQTQVGIAKAHKKCFGDEPVMSHEEYRQYVLANYDVIEAYYEDMFNKYDDYSPQEEMIYG